MNTGNKGKVLNISPKMREHLRKVRSENARKQWTPEARARQREFMLEQRRADPRMLNPRKGTAGLCLYTRRTKCTSDT